MHDTERESAQTESPIYPLVIEVDLRADVRHDPAEQMNPESEVFPRACGDSTYPLVATARMPRPADAPRFLSRHVPG